jgi:AraC-like DNA-binding protein
MGGSDKGGDRRGILNPRAGEERFAFTRHAPAPELAAVVERYWTVRWDLRGRPPYAQETLPYPCVNVVFGTHRPGVHGVCTTRFVAHLEGEGWVVGIKFRPGGFRPFASFPMVDLTDRELAITDVFGAAGAAVDRAVRTAPTDAERVPLAEDFLRGCRPPYDADALEAARAVDLARGDLSIARAADLAVRSGIGLRSLQRLFRSHVGVSPKWVIRRFRVQDAAERAAAGTAVDWAAVALDLGYFDQSHFTRDFKAQIGRTPAEYAALCAAPGG